jgi:indole-3-glycerol phosphate synthase
VTLREIIGNKVEEVERLKKARPLREMKALAMAALSERRPRDFRAALIPGGPGDIRIIAEVKKASPSRGVIRASFDPLALALEYEANGAAAISVITDERYFQGRIEYLRLIAGRGGVALPVLRKDFIVDEYQVYESAAAGADSILLIAAALGRGELETLLGLGASLGLTPLVETRDEAEIKTAVEAGAGIIGINNRDLKTFRVDMDTALRLASAVPKDRLVVAESGIEGFGDIMRLKEAGVSAFLVGTSLAREKDAGKKLRELRGVG